MTEEERQLLLTALCGYLPYKVKCFAEDREYGDLGTLYSVDPFENLDPNIYIQYDKGNVISFFTSEIKPYLRPISSMTEEEKRYLMSLKYHPSAFKWKNLIISSQEIIDWLNAHHFDYRKTKEGKTMIEAGLALEALEGMYNQNK